jgi:ElaB/YqjD/DUF883 family membrane-anchored ribosome-binding protein
LLFHDVELRVTRTLHLIPEEGGPMATAVVEKPACESSTFLRAAAVACRQAVHAAHEARLLKTIAEDAVETRVYEAAHRIRKHPFMSVAMAFAIGVPLGALIGWAGGHARQVPRG